MRDQQYGTTFELELNKQQEPKRKKEQQDVGQEGFHGDVPAAPAPERHHEGSVAQLYQANAGCRWVHERGGEFLPS